MQRTNSSKSSKTTLSKKKTSNKKLKATAKKKVVKKEEVFDGIRGKLGRKVITVTWDKRQWILKIGTDGPFYYPLLASLYKKLYEEAVKAKAKTTLFDAAKLRKTLKDTEDLFYQMSDEISKKLDESRENI